MVNVFIYLKSTHNAKELVELLLAEKLIASASIDENNVSYKMAEEKIIQNVYSVITAQSKSLLLPEIIKLTEQKYGGDVPINCSPIVGSNNAFLATILTKTIPT
ncbi:MAG: hypothetical protein WCG64_10025 [Flavobacteriia bacterium]|jgi:uncharacterized protein involved in tolerance to divalent cations